MSDDNAAVKADRAARLKRLSTEKVTIDGAKVRGKILFYGVKGSGKSTSAGFLAKKLAQQSGGKVLWIDSSEGYVSLRNHPSITKGVEFEVQPFTDFEDLNVIAMAVDRKIPPYDDVSVVVLDELSKMAAIRLTDIVEKNHAKDSIPDWGDWRELSNEMRRLLARFFRAAGVSIIAIAHERTTTTGGKNPSVIFEATPDFNPAVSKIVSEDMHMVARFTAEAIKTQDNTAQYKRIAQVHPSWRIDAKSRVGGLNLKVDSLELVGAIANWISEGAPEADVQPTVIIPELERRAEAEADAEDDTPDWSE